MTSLDFVVGLVVGLLGAAALYLFLRRRTGRLASEELPPIVLPREMEPNGTNAGDRSPAPPPERSRFPSPVVDGTPATQVAGAMESVEHAVPRPSAPATPAQDPSLPRKLTARTETLRLSQRIILHVYAQGVLPPGSVAPPELCQAGMVETLGIPQSGLAAVLRRLEAAGTFTTERGHVRGRDRRQKIYRLSDRGRELAEELRVRGNRRPRR